MRWVLPPDVTATGGARRRGAGRPPVPLVIAAIAAVAVLAIPPVYLLIRAGFGDAWAILGRGATWETFGRTLLLAATVALGSVVVGATMAWLVVRTNLPGRTLWGVLSIAPLAMPSFVAALALSGATGDNGLVSRLLSPLGIGPIPRISGLAGATLALVMATFPYVYLLTVAALRSADPSLEEAARGLGRGSVGAFVAGTLPQLRRALVGGALLAGLYSISDYGAVSLMRYDTITRSIFTRYESGFDRQPAAVLGLVLIALTAVFLILEIRGRGRGGPRTGPGAVRTSRTVSLGRWRVPALGFAGLVGSAFVVAPVAVMVYWLGRAIDNGTVGDVPVQAVVTSLLLATAAAVVTTVAALPVALLARRYPRTWTRLIERSGYAANALPGVVVGLAFVFLAARYLPFIYQTFPLLIVAYLVRFFAQALSGVDTALAAVNPRAEEVARSLGRTPLQVVREITVPVMRPGVIAGATLVFLSVIKELPATKLLLPTGSRTLATEVWRKTQVGQYGSAAVPALLLLAVSIPLIVVAVREHAAERGEALPAAGT